MLFRSIYFIKKLRGNNIYLSNCILVEFVFHGLCNQDPSPKCIWIISLLVIKSFLILGHFDIEGCDVWYACTEPYYGADGEIKHSLSTSGKLFHTTQVLDVSLRYTASTSALASKQRIKQKIYILNFF